jgi:hypothetical protein
MYTVLKLGVPLFEQPVRAEQPAQLLFYIKSYIIKKRQLKSMIQKKSLPKAIVLNNRFWRLTGFLNKLNLPKRAFLLLMFLTFINGLYAQTEFPAGDYWSLDAGLGMTGQPHYKKG